ncbi:MAG: agmatine deiminase family protein [Myxococcota bacterium]
MNPPSLPKVVLPPEWEPQDALMVTWPHPETDWAPVRADVEPIWIAIAQAVTPHQRLWIVVPNQTEHDRVWTLLDHAGIDRRQVDLWQVPSNDTWARDHGPLTVRTMDGRCIPLDFTFNGWGGRYPAHDDNAITAGLAQQGAFASAPWPVEMVLEGGSLDVDGQGALLTTRRCLLNPNRNPNLDEETIAQRLRQTLGVEVIHWLTHGHLEGDDTDGHIDTLARFAPSGTIVHVACDDPDDPHAEPLAAMALELAALRDRQGRPYRLLPLPWPRPKHSLTGERLPASYANYVILNGAILAPCYQDPADEQAQAVLAEAYPGRTVVGIDSLGLIEQGGSLHCLTMQLPRGTAAQPTGTGSASI